MIEINPKLKSFIESKGFDVDECLVYLIARRHDLKCRCSEDVFQFLERNKLIMLNLLTNKIIPTVGIYEGEEIKLPEIDLSIEQEVRDRIDEYRSMFKGVRSGSIGVKQKVIELLVQFCLQNQVSFDDVLEATKVYMSYTDFQMISNADNFISKLDKSGQEISLLKMALEEQSMSSDTEERTYKVL